MNTAKGFTLIELMIVVVIIGLLATIALPNFLALKDHAREAGTKENAHTLQLAAEDYAVRNDGLYSDQGVGFVGDLLPQDPNGGNNLQNTFDGTYTEPTWGGVAAAKGDIGIVAIAQAGVNVGYSITGFGRIATIITLTNGI